MRSTLGDQEQTQPRLENLRRGFPAGALLLAALVFAAYLPAILDAGFVWDDDEYLTANPLIVAPDGLRKIWFSFESPSQYFPLVYTSFRVEHALWGFDPRGYHLTNVVLHLLNALLLWWLLARLEVGGAWFAAALFALHPVQVESVAWITERKNVLSTLFFLASLAAWLEFVREERARPWRWYALSLALFPPALFAKTSTVTLPAVMALLLWLRGQPIGRGRVVQLLPFAACAVPFALLTIWWERYHQGTRGPVFDFSIPERLLIAGRALWFYPQKLVWPVDLAFSYPRWEIDSARPAGYLWPLATCAAAGLLWSRRDHWPRGVAAGLLFYLITIAPMLGFVALYTFRYTFVADHYQYLASAGIFCVATALYRQRVAALPEGVLQMALGRAVPAAILLALTAMTWRQTHAYRDEETLWRDTIRKNPTSSLARVNLGNLLVDSGKAEEGMAEFRDVLAHDPGDAQARYNLAWALAETGRIAEAEAEYRETIRRHPESSSARVNLAVLLAQSGRVGERVALYREALRIEPSDAGLWHDLGMALLSAGAPDEAVPAFNRALTLDPGRAMTRAALKMALAGATRSR